MQGSPYAAPQALHWSGAAASWRRATCGGHALPDIVEHSSRGTAEQAVQQTSSGAIATTPSGRSGGMATSSRGATACAFGR